MACDRVDCHDAAIWDAIGLAVCSYLVIIFGMRLKNVAVKTGMGCSLLFMHPQITEAELACLFLEVIERFKGTDAGKVVFKVQRDMEILGK